VFPDSQMLSAPSMTAQRQERNGPWAGSIFRPAIAVVAVLASVLGQAYWGFSAQAVTTERVVVNRYTGLAIEGFDPVGYFVDARPMIGEADFEASQAGAVWRFRNEGNRAAFVAHPEIYGPQFGGYDPIDVARGITVAGNPRFWVISKGRLYLFGREQSRETFSADPSGFVREAKQRWPALEQDLSR
jgi:YHS domain-containing protein